MSDELLADGLKIRSSLQWVAIIRWMIVAMLLGTAASAPAKQNDALSAKVIAWANENIGPYHQYHEFAQTRQHPEVPVPPQVDPPCHLCGDTTETQGEKQVAEWVAKAQEPEHTYMSGLLGMGHFVAELESEKLGTLSPEAVKALSQFENSDAFMSDAVAIAGELVNLKADPMVRRYGKDPTRAYAGINFILAAGKTLALLGGHNDGSDQLLQDAATWEKAVADKINRDVLSGHNYNLCPVYMQIIRSVEQLGGPSTDIDFYMWKVQKMKDLLNFNLNMKLQVAIDDTDGSHMHATWAGKAKFKINLELLNGCYTPIFDDEAKMAVNVSNWDMINVETNSDGGTEIIPVRLTSPHSYDVTLGTPQLNLCDPEPIFQIPLSNLNYPPEEVTSKGRSSKTALLGQFLSAVVTANEVNSAATNAVTGQRPSLPDEDSNSQASNSSSDSGTSEMDQDEKLIQSHDGDTTWLMSPAGQAVIAHMQKQALQTTQSKIADAGVVVPNASTFEALAASIASAHLPWTNGQAEPVNKTLHVKEDNTDITLTISVEQASQ